VRLVMVLGREAIAHDARPAMPEGKSTCPASHVLITIPCPILSLLSCMGWTTDH